jgi:hypothetical protein
MMDGPIGHVNSAVNHMMDGPIAQDWKLAENLHLSGTDQWLRLESLQHIKEGNSLQHLDWKVTSKVHLSPSMKLYDEITLEIQIT